jgi:lipoate-protein ligase A
VPPAFRVIDSGVREGRRQIAFDQALIDLHKAGQLPDTIRFLRFPPTALIGRHQALSQEVNVDYCRARGIGIARRITGGGAIYFDEGQLGWELVFARATLRLASLDGVARELCEAAAGGLRTLGVEATYRPRNDIEVDGRKVGGTGGFFDGDTLFYQGTVLIDTDPADMLAALKVPAAKLAKRALDSAASRVVTLKELLGTAPDVAAVREALLRGFSERLGIEPVPGAITAEEEALSLQYHATEIGTEAFVAEIDDPQAMPAAACGSFTGRGGTITAYVRLTGPRRDSICECLITGDFLLTPPRAVYDLEAALRGIPVTGVRAAVECFFAHAKADLLSVAPGEFATAIEAAVTASGHHPQPPPAGPAREAG